MFASPFDHHTPLYVTRWPDTSAIGYDALSLDWYKLGPGLFACPPWRLISRVLRKLKDEQRPIDVVLVLPWWEGAPWWSLVEEVIGQCVRVRAGPWVASRVWPGCKSPAPTVRSDLLVGRVKSSRTSLRIRPRGVWEVQEGVVIERVSV